MAKTVLKETFIVLLVTIAIGLILAIIFYQFVPSNKVIPIQVTAYSAPEEVQKEIEEAANEELTGTNEVYEITDSDLDLFKSTKSYNPGKVDPFSASSSSDTGSEGNSTAVEGPSGNSGTTQNTDRNTTDNYYQASNIGGRH